MTDSNTFSSTADKILAAAAARDVDGIAASIRRDLWSDGLVDVCGVLLRGGGHTPFAADNPWDIAHDRDLTGILTRIWAPVAAELPDFVDTLSRAVMGLALARVGGEYRLGYLALKPRYGRTVQAPRDVAELPAVAGDGELHWFWGGPPAHLDLPAPIRTVASVHASLNAPSAEWQMDTATLDQSVGELLREQLAQWREEDEDEDEEDDDLEHAHDDDETTGFDDHRLLAEYSPGMQWSILVPPATDDSCLVAIFDHQDLSVFDTAPFWTWFDDHATAMFFGDG